MSRKFAALTIVAVAGALLLPDVSWSAGGGMGAGGMRAGGFRAPFIFHRNARAGILRHRHHSIGAPRFGRGVGPGFHYATQIPPDVTRARIPPAATSALNFRSRIRLSHRAYLSGWVFPITTLGDSSYIGTPYDPAESIPVYAGYPYPPQDPAAPAAQPRAPRIGGAADESANPDACRSEKVTVPASEGQREITVVRC